MVIFFYLRHTHVHVLLLWIITSSFKEKNRMLYLYWSNLILFSLKLDKNYVNAQLEQI